MITWQADFQSLPLKNLAVQAKDPSRVTLVDCERTGRKALKLTALPGDENIAGSGPMRRCDGYAITTNTLDPDVYYGGEMWFANSIRLNRAEFWRPYWHPYNLFDWHNYPEGGVCATFGINFARDPRSDSMPGLLRAQLAYGDRDAPTYHNVILGEPLFDEWMDFVSHIVWSAKDNGKFDLWLNGRLVMSHRGPTLYQSVMIKPPSGPAQLKPCGVYLKLANYFLPVTPAEITAKLFAPTPASSVIHDRVIIGTTQASVTA